LNKEFKVTGPQQQIDEGSLDKLWNSFGGELNIPGIEDFDMGVIDEFAKEFAKRWIDWKSDDVSEKEWFKRYDNEEFYERWLEFKDRLNAGFYSDEWTTWFVQYYWEHEAFPDGFIPELVIFDDY